MKQKLFVRVCVPLLTVFAVNVFAAPDILSAFYPPKSSCTPSPTITVQMMESNQFCAEFPISVGSCAPIPHPSPAQMKSLYDAMTHAFGSLAAACAAEAPLYHSSPRDCIDQWTCYWHGGKDSEGGKCDGDGQACSSLPPV